MSQPAPVERGIVVPDALIAFINERYLLSERAREELVALIRERDALGRSKYGQPLMSEDGRSGVQDCLEELGDLLQYAMKCKLNGTQNLGKLRRMLRTAVIVLEDVLE